MATEITGSTGITTPNIVSPLQTISTRLDLTGGQIKFPATQVPSSDANTLDDYEEGTWTPTYYGLTTSGTTTYEARSGHYRKIGDVVHCWGFIGVTNATGTGNALIGGFPFQAVAAYTNSIQSIGAWNYATTGGQLYSLIQGESIVAQILLFANGNISNLTMDPTIYMRFYLTYITSN